MKGSSILHYIKNLFRTCFVGIHETTSPTSLQKQKIPKPIALVMERLRFNLNFFFYFASGEYRKCVGW